MFFLFVCTKPMYTKPLWRKGAQNHDCEEIPSEHWGSFDIWCKNSYVNRIFCKILWKRFCCCCSGFKLMGKTASCVCKMPFPQLLAIFKMLLSWMDETAAAAYVRGRTAAQRRAAARWDGGAEGCHTGRRKFKWLQSRGIHRAEEPEQQTAHRQILPPLMHPPRVSIPPGRRWLVRRSHWPPRQVSCECKHEWWVWWFSQTLWPKTPRLVKKTSEAAFRLHRAAERQRGAGCGLELVLSPQRWVKKWF